MGGFKVPNLVSVIIPTYKRPFKILGRALNSVLKQSYTNLEIIIVDDSPNSDLNRNEVENEIKKINDSRVRYIQHEFNQGACKARNTGIQHSNGNYIAFLDDDDEWLPNKLELQLQKFEDPEVGLVYCDAYFIFIKNDSEIKQYIRRNSISGWVYDKLFVKNYIGSTSFVILKREALDLCGMFDISLRSAQDLELWLRISKKYKVDFVDIPLAKCYRHDGERISTNINNKIQGQERVIELYMDYLVLHPKIYSLRRLKLVPYYAIRDNYRIAFKKWLEAVKIYPFQKENITYLAKIFFYRIRSII